MRFPRAIALLGRAVWWLPARSRLRKAWLRRAVVSGWEALNRGDLDVAFALYHPQIASTVDPLLLGVGLGHTRGREARVAVQTEAMAEFREFRFEAEELIDLGDSRILVVGRMSGSGRTSGAAFDNDWSALFTVAAGRVIREQIFLDRAKALEAAGLRE